MAKKLVTKRFESTDVDKWRVAAAKKQKKVKPNLTLWMETELNKSAEKSGGKG